MKAIVVSLAVLVSIGYYSSNLRATSPVNPPRDVVILQPYQAATTVNGKYVIQGFYIYTSSSSSNAPSFGNYPNSSVSFAQAGADLASAGFRLEHTADQTGIQTWIR